MEEVRQHSRRALGCAIKAGSLFLEEQSRCRTDQQASANAMKEKVGWDPFRSIYSSWEVNTGLTVAALLLSSVAFGVCVYIAYRRRPKGEIDEAGTRHLSHGHTQCATESTQAGSPQTPQPSESSTNTCSIVPSRKLLIRPKKVTNVSALPLEIQLQILSLLSTRELCMMGQVNRFYCQLRSESTRLNSSHT